MEKVIFLVVIVFISLLHAWWRKKQEANEKKQDSEPWPGQQPHRPPVARPESPPSKAASWEEELRRLLQGEEPMRPAPPPVVVQQPRSAPPPLPTPVTSRPAPAPRPVLIPQGDPDMERGLSVQMPSLEHSAQAFLRASQLESKVAAHMHRVDQQVTTHPKLELKRETSPEIRQAINLVRHRPSQRAAIIVSIVLGPPKAMEV